MTKTLHIAGLLMAMLLAAPLVMAEDAAEIDWLELIPPDELKAMEALPEIDHDGGKMEQPLPSAGTVASLDGRRGSLVGYVVPIEGDAQGKVSEFFLVPYYGACLHMPPPPPNQIIHIEPDEPIDPGGIWDAFRLSGTLRVSSTENPIAKSGYSFELESIEKMEQRW